METSIPAGRPKPLADADTAPFWAAAQERRLSVQLCENCDRAIFPPKPACPHCVRELAWRDLNGRGSVYSFCISRMNFIGGYKAPYIVAWVASDEHPECIFNCNIVDCAIEDVRIGMPVEVVFETRPEGVTVPQFRPIREGAPA